MARLAHHILIALALTFAGCSPSEICDNGEDDDGDGLTDCADCDCDGSCDEDCEDGRDNDGDGATDCYDDDCDGSCDEVCGDERDNDGDGATDCADDDCDGQCAEDCDDSRDNDGDGAIDCLDTECDGTEHGCAEVCDDLRDNDGDGAVDCGDSDCDGTATGCPEVCGDERDNDGDGAADCLDTDCDGTCPEVCDDSRDNDGDGATDCDDDDCDGTEHGCVEVCDDGRDNDGDGLTDCEDGSCSAELWCYESDCDDDIDQDGDGLIDCADDECWGAGCALTLARVTGGWAMGFDVEDRSTRRWYSGTLTSTRILTDSRREHIEMDAVLGYSIVGTLQAVTTGGVWTTCSWSVARSAVSWAIGRTTYSSIDYSVRNVGRYSFELTSGCGHTTSTFLPTAFELRGRYVATTGGGLWFHGSTTGSTDTTSSSVRDDPSFYRHDWRRTVRWTIPVFATGDPWVLHEN